MHKLQKHGFVVWAVIAIGFSHTPAIDAETYGNFHTMGIVLNPPTDVAIEQVAAVRLFVLDGDAERRVLDPVRITGDAFFVVSVFDLTPDTTYSFRAEYVNKQGQLLHQERFSGRTRPDPGEPPAARKEIHVAKTGDDSNPGTAASPKKTLRAALQIANQAGTHVVIHEGVYYEGGLPAVGKGAPEAPIVIRGAPGESVIIDGSEIVALTARWKDLGGGYYSTPYAGQSWLVCVRSRKAGVARRLYPVGSLDKLMTKKVGPHAFDSFRVQEAYHCTGKEIVIYCPYYRPEDMVIHIAHQSSVVEHSNSRNVVYSDLTCRFFQGQTFYINNSNDIAFRRCVFEYCALPIAVKRESHRLLIEHCRFIDDGARWGFLPKGMDDVGYSSHLELGAVYVHNPYEGRGMVIRNNVIDGLFDGVHLTPMGAKPTVRTHETDFYNNRIIKVCDDLIEADGQCRNLRIFRNRMENFLSGVSLAQGYGGPTYVLYNIMGGAGNTSATQLPPHFEGYPIKTNGGTQYGTTGQAFFFHNTCYTTVPNTSAFRVQVAAWERFVMANNIWQGTRDGFVFWRDPASPMESRSDLIHADEGALLKIRKSAYASREAAARHLAFFSKAVVADPKLIDPSRGDYRPGPGSPAIDAGAILPGVNDRNYQGKAPDIGALETGPIR